jgi:hypothetical protein
MQQGKGKTYDMSSKNYACCSSFYNLIDLHLNRCSKKMPHTSCSNQGGVEEEPSVVVKEGPMALQMVLHEQTSMVVEEEQLANICTPKKTVKRAIQKLTLRKNSIPQFYNCAML